MPIPSEPPEPFLRWPRKWKEYLFELLDWVQRKQPIPDKNDFAVSEKPEGLRFSMRPAAVQRIVQSAVHPLKLVNATTGGVAKVRVLLGNTAGRKAAAGMTAGTDDPVFTVTLTANGVRYIYADITLSYNTSTGVWSSTASAISEGASVPAATATHYYFEIGHVTRESDGAGGFRAVSIVQEVGGSQWVARTGSASTYADANGLQ